MATVNYIDVLSTCFIKGVCCKLTNLAAILDAMIDFRISDYQRTIYRVVMDYCSPKLWCRHQIITLIIMKHTDLFTWNLWPLKPWCSHQETKTFGKLHFLRYFSVAFWIKNRGKIFLQLLLPEWNAFFCRHICLTRHNGNVFFDSPPPPFLNLAWCTYPKITTLQQQKWQI